MVYTDDIKIRIQMVDDELFSLSMQRGYQKYFYGSKNAIVDRNGAVVGNKRKGFKSKKWR